MSLDTMRLSLPETVKRGLVSTATELLQEGLYHDIDEVDSDLGTGLFHCCCKGYFDLACLFLKNGATCNFINKFGSTPLHTAADCNHIDLVRLLLHHGANCDAQNFNGDTPCHLASRRGHYQIVGQLLSWGCDHTIKNNKQKNCRQEACAQDHKQIIRLLGDVKGKTNTVGKTSSPESQALGDSLRVTPRRSQNSSSPTEKRKTPRGRRPVSDALQRRETCPMCCQHLPPVVYYDPPSPSGNVEASRARDRQFRESVTRSRVQEVGPRSRARESASTRSSRYFEIDEQNSWEYVYMSPSERQVDVMPAYGAHLARQESDDSKLVSK